MTGICSLWCNWGCVVLVGFAAPIDGWRQEGSYLFAWICSSRSLECLVGKCLRSRTTWFVWFWKEDVHERLVRYGATATCPPGTTVQESCSSKGSSVLSSRTASIFENNSSTCVESFPRWSEFEKKILQTLSNPVANRMTGEYEKEESHLREWLAWLVVHVENTKSCSSAPKVLRKHPNYTFGWKALQASCLSARWSQRGESRMSRCSYQCQFLALGACCSLGYSLYEKDEKENLAVNPTTWAANYSCSKGSGVCALARTKWPLQFWQSC